MQLVYGCSHPAACSLWGLAVGPSEASARCSTTNPRILITDPGVYSAIVQNCPTLLGDPQASPCLTHEFVAPACQNYWVDVDARHF